MIPVKPQSEMTWTSPASTAMFWAAMAEHRQTLAHRVIHARKAKGWSKEKLALEAGVAYKTIVRIEQAEVTKPQSGTLDKLADALDLDIRFLDDGRPTMDELEEEDGPLERIERMLGEVLSRLPELAEDRLAVEALEEEAARRSERTDSSHAAEKPGPQRKARQRKRRA